MSRECERPVGNRLLDALPPNDYERLLDNLKPVRLTLGEVIYESSKEQKEVYFPTTAHIALLYKMTNGSTAQVGLIGNEGMLGVALFMGGDTTLNTGIAQGAGRALKLPAELLQLEFRRGGPFQQQLLRYTQALITQISGTAACNRVHSLEQRLCRWLLMTHDRCDSDELQMTQMFISHMLGMRRESVNQVAQSLQAKGLINYARGRLKIANRQALEACACECYAVVKAEQTRVPWPAAA